MSKWLPVAGLFIFIVSVIGAYISGYGSGKKHCEQEQLNNQITMTDKSIAKLNEVDKTYDAIFDDIRQTKDDKPCPVANPIRRAIDLMPDGGSSE